MVVWNTGSAAARYRLKNKKRKKPQASSSKRQAALMMPQLKGKMKLRRWC